MTPPLDFIAAQLEGLEETIISKLIDRAQFKVNSVIYLPGKSGFRGERNASLFDIRLRCQEEMDARFGRFRVPEERPFTHALPRSRRCVNLPATGLHLRRLNSVNITRYIRESYGSLIEKICMDGDDGNYGSSVEHDVYALQALSRRIHFGAFYVAESKFRDAPEEYRRLVMSGDREKLMARLTRARVEETIIRRVREKVIYLQSHVNRGIRHCIDPEIVVWYYRDYIIPLTKEGEIRHLMNRRR